MCNGGQWHWALKYDLHNQLLLWNFFDLAGIITELRIPYIIVSSEIVPLNSHHCPIFGIEPYNTRLLYSSLQLQRAVHFKVALVQEQPPLHPRLHPQRNSSLHDLVTSGSVVQKGCHSPSFKIHPQSPGEGRSGHGVSAWPQQWPAW